MGSTNAMKAAAAQNRWKRLRRAVNAGFARRMAATSSPQRLDPWHDILKSYGAALRAILRVKPANRKLRWTNDEHYYAHQRAWIGFTSDDASFDDFFSIRISSVPRFYEPNKSMIPEVTVEAIIDTFHEDQYGGGQLNKLRAVCMKFSIEFELDQYGGNAEYVNVIYAAALGGRHWHYISYFLIKVLPNQLKGVTHGPVLKLLGKPELWFKVFWLKKENKIQIPIESIR